MLEELTSGDCRQDLATKLVKLFLGRGLAGPFLDYLTRREVARTSEFPTGSQIPLPKDGSPGEKYGPLEDSYVLGSLCSELWRTESTGPGFRCCVTPGSLPNHSGLLNCEPSCHFGFFLILKAGRIISPPWVSGASWVQPSPFQQTHLPIFLDDPNTLFRSNSLASKSMEQFMKVSWQSWHVWLQVASCLAHLSPRACWPQMALGG